MPIQSTVKNNPKFLLIGAFVTTLEINSCTLTMYDSCQIYVLELP